MSNFLDEINKEAKLYGGGGARSDFFEFEEGENRIRILHHPKVIAYHFPPTGKPDVCVGIDEGCPHHGADAKKPTIRLCTYVINRKSKKIEFAELPVSLSYALNDLQKNPDYAFSEFPMPYDVTVTHDPKNPDPKAKYRLLPSPKIVDISPLEKEELEEVLKKMTPEQYVEKRKGKQEVSPRKEEPKGENYPVEDINPDDIPF